MTQKYPNYYALIMAGGGGTRLWPLSRKDRPKQALPLVDDDSMFHVSVKRLAPLFDLDHIFIITGANMVNDLRLDAPEIPTQNFIVEPFGQDSGPAAALGTTHILAHDPNAIIAVLTSDHHIADVEGFLNALDTAYNFARKGQITTLGITPTFPSTAFGYIERGDFIEETNGFKIYQSTGFREKPNESTACQFLESGRYSWNSGMFIWQASQALAEFERQRPEMHHHFKAIHAAYGSPNYRNTIEQCWPQMTKLSVDYAIMEKAENVVVIPVSIGWSDIGSWSTLYEVLAEVAPSQAENALNIVRGDRAEIIPIDSSGTLVFSNRTVVTIGVNDLVIIDTPDAILICRRDRSQDVRKVVDYLKQQGRDELL